MNRDGMRQAIGWWEARRIPYNIMLFAVGLLTIAIVEVVGSCYARPGEDIEEPLGIILGAVVYGVAANLAFTLGWVIEIFWAGMAPIRRAIFWAGTIFSAGLTLLPAVVLPVLWAVFGFQHVQR